MVNCSWEERCFSLVDEVVDGTVDDSVGRATVDGRIVDGMGVNGMTVDEGKVDNGTVDEAVVIVDIVDGLVVVVDVVPVIVEATVGEILVDVDGVRVVDGKIFVDDAPVDETVDGAKTGNEGADDVPAIVVDGDRCFFSDFCS